MIVADTNIVVYLLTDCPQRTMATWVREIDSDWCLPFLWRHEWLNVLSNLARQGYIKKSDSALLWHNAIRLFSSGEQSVKMVDALEIAIEHNVSAYDAQYIALAKESAVPCITEDRRLIKTFPHVAISMQSFLDKHNKDTKR